MRRIGIDVGGTNTDAVILEDTRVVHFIKTPTTSDVTSGIVTALARLLEESQVDPAGLDAVMIGTTHFTNAVVQRRDLNKVAAVRIGLPASAFLDPFIDWPEDLAQLVNGKVFMLEGGHEYDGRPIVPFDREGMRSAAREIRDAGILSVGISAVFSPLTAECEEEAAAILLEEHPEAQITQSHNLGRIGLLARENVTLLNACLLELARRTTRAFREALLKSGIQAPLFLTQNDGTVMLAEVAEAYPVFGFASGPTNSMRGAAFLSGLSEAIVVDVGGTTTDIGCLKMGFPRDANNVVEVGGVRTLFRMPDLLSLGLGGGSLVTQEPLKIGPASVGYQITERSLVFGGKELTCTDLAVAAGKIELGDRATVQGLGKKFLATALDTIAAMIDEGVDRMKSDATELPLIAVGGGSFLIPDHVSGVSQVVRVPHHEVANAVGAAIAQVSGEIDQIYQNLTRDEAIQEAQRAAEQKAIVSGADPDSLEVVEVEDLPLAYLPGSSLRIRVRVVGNIR